MNWHYIDCHHFSDAFSFSSSITGRPKFSIVIIISEICYNNLLQLCFIQLTILIGSYIILFGRTNIVSVVDIDDSSSLHLWKYYGFWISELTDLLLTYWKFSFLVLFPNLVVWRQLLYNKIMMRGISLTLSECFTSLSRGIQVGYFYSTRWGRLLWFCPLALLLCWHLVVGCGRLRDKQHHRSSSAWLISSELCCPTSECVYTPTYALRDSTVLSKQ